ncbi:MAG: DoxX family protein [Brevundimonas sp.]|uniref:DoxX family protein n=1 Tax=Brevundimonas sp. TaxID=1871086 RepID=UPI0025C03493|nr:DoxX family protein [Brevundimonas sp.]MBX3477114.1 DoxX family protein [Brevundimonas sp.]
MISSSTRAHTPAQLRLCATYRNVGLWTLQGWLVMFFVAAGYAKLTESMSSLAALMVWPAVADEGFVRGVGAVEIVLALALLAPLVSWRVGRPALMIGAVGLLVLETVMAGVHALGGDWGLAAVNLVLMALTAVVLMGRRQPG